MFSPDWPLWALGAGLTGAVYAASVAALNRRNHNARGRRWMLAAEASGALVLIAGAVCGITGLWSILPAIALAYLMVGVPVAAALLITGAVVGASEDEYAQIERLRSELGAVRDTRIRGGSADSDSWLN